MNLFSSQAPAWARSFAVRYWPHIASLLVGSAMVGCIVMEELRLRAGSFGAVSDYWEHAAVVRALIDNPWHPMNPHLAIATPSPRFGPISVLNALLARALGLDALSALSLAAVANTFAFVAGIWLFFCKYFRDPRAGLYGLLVMLGSWWEAWTFTSIYQPKVLLSVASYPWLAAFAVTLFGLALALRVLRALRARWWEFALLVLWAALVFLTHQLTAMMALTALFLLALTEPTVSRSRRAGVAATAVTGCLVSSLWPYFSVWRLLAGGHQDAGWVGRGVSAAVEGALIVHRHRFYRLPELLSALGLGLLGVLFLPYFFFKWRRLFVGLGVLAMLGPFALNAFIPLPLGHRFIFLAVFYLHVAVVWLLMALTPGSAEFVRMLDRRWLRAASLVVVCSVLAIFAYHNVQRTRREWAYFQSYARRGESPLVRYARRASELAGTRAVILGSALTSWPIPAFGPKVVALQHENPFVSDADQRALDVDLFFSPGITDEERSNLIRKYRVTHVIVKGEPRWAARHFLQTHARRDRLPGGYSLFALANSFN